MWRTWTTRTRGLREYMIEMMRWWVEDVGIDGFRCDVAEMVPTDFWEDGAGCGWTGSGP